MPRSPVVLLASLLMMFPEARASAQRAGMQVAAQVLPSREALMSGSHAPQAASGHTMVANVVMNDFATRVIASHHMPLQKNSALPGQLQVSLGFTVASNVGYRLEVSECTQAAKTGQAFGLYAEQVRGAAKARIPLAVRDGSAPNTITCRVRDPGSHAAPCAVTVTLIASSVT